MAGTELSGSLFVMRDAVTVAFCHDVTPEFPITMKCPPWRAEIPPSGKFSPIKNP